jgi:hypothetical protein
VGTPPNAPYAFFLPDGDVIRGRSDANGAIEVFLPPSTSYQFGILDPRYNMFALASGTSAPSGATTELPLLHYQSFDGLTDTNGDGIPDIVKPILDLNPAGPVDQIIPGMTDLAAVDQGLDAASKSLTTTTGIIATVALQGEAQAVALVGSAAGGNQQTAYVATGSYGLAIVDATDAKNPIVLSQLKLSGTATDVAVDPNLHIAAVATGGNGLQLVNVEEMGTPALIQIVNINATHVVIVDGIAYANDGEKLDAIDLVSGRVLQSLELGGQFGAGLAREGSMLYTVDSTGLLNTIDISSGQMVLRGSTSSLFVGSTGKIFVGDGIVYVSVAFGGYATFDVSNPDRPSFLASGGGKGIFSNAIALNGSGLGVAVGESTFGINLLQLVDSSDPTNVNGFITSFTLPANPFGVAIGEGTAFVADGTAGLQVVNYEATDTKGVAPTIQVLSAPTSVDPAAPGVELAEGQTVSFKVKVTDDVQVGNVELLATATDPKTGQTQRFVVKNSVSFPFDVSGVLPTIAALDGATQVTLQIAATDTGGNTTLSAPMVVTLVPDTTPPPKLLQQSLAEGENRTTDPGSVTFTFSKPLDPVTVSASTFFLVGSDGSKVPVTVGLRDNGQTVELAYNQGLALGQYQLEVDAANVTDRVGNALGSTILTTHFTVSTVSQFTDTWIGPQTGGLWTDVANWSAGRVPDASDDVRVDLGPGGTISVSNPESVAALTLTGLGTLSIDAGSLTVAGQADIQGTLVVGVGAVFDANGATTIGTLTLGGGSTAIFNAGGGTLTGSGTVTVTGLTTLAGANMTGPGTTIMQGGAQISDVTIAGGRVLENQGVANWTQGPNGIVFGTGGGVFRNDVGAVINANFGPLNPFGGGGGSIFSFDPTSVSLFDNRGTFNQIGGAPSAIGVSFTNSGTLVDNGEVVLSGGGTSTGTMTVNANASLLFNASYTVAGGTVSGNGKIFVNDGVAADTGLQTVPTTVTVEPPAQYAFTGTTRVATGTLRFGGAVTLAGTTSIAAGATVSVAGNLTLQSTSVLDIQLGSADPSIGENSVGLLQVGGLAVLAGTLNALPQPGFAPTVGRTFTFLTFARDAGAFATVTGTALGSTEALVLDTSDATDLRFDVVSTAATTALTKKPAVALLTTSASVSARTATPPPVHKKMRF